MIEIDERALVIPSVLIDKEDRLMWNAIQYVTSGLTLAAFIVAGGVYLYSRANRSKTDLIQSALAKDRSTLVAQALKDEYVNVETVPPDERTGIILEILRTRERRHLANIIVICFAAALAAAIAVYSISRASLDSSGSRPPAPDAPIDGSAKL